MISNYTLADTAYVFAIIEGVATVVAAVGAIIAVVVTKKIAKNQNILFVEQIKISATQAEISNHQNKIALFEKRYLVFHCLNKVLQFINLVASADSLIQKMTARQILELWVLIQRNEYCLTEKISFISDTIIEQAEDKPEPSEDEVLSDISLLQRQLHDDSFVLSQGSFLFPDPIRSELIIIKEKYSIFILRLLAEYGCFEIPMQLSTEQLYNDLLKQGNMFTDSSPIMIALNKELVL